MPMMDVRKVRMLMHHHLVPVRVLMRLVPVPREIVFVLVMHVVRVPMAMLPQVRDCAADKCCRLCNALV